MLAGLDLNTRQIAEITKAWADLNAARRSQIEAFRRDPLGPPSWSWTTPRTTVSFSAKSVLSRKLGSFFSAPSEGDISLRP